MGRFDGKSEKPTAKRRQKARREGTVAKSPEVGTALSLLGALLALRVATPPAFTLLRRETTLMLGSVAGEESLTFAYVGGSFAKLLLALLAPFLAVAVLTAMVAGLAQTGFKATPGALKPKLNRLDPRAGLRRMSPVTAGWDLAKTLAKLGLLFALIYGPLTAWIEKAGTLRTLDAAITSTLGQAWLILVRAVLLTVVIAAADYAYQRWRTTRELRMTKEEVKQEGKDQEGDPLIKGQRRRRAMELSRNRMLADVATADVVITNPTHLAIALRYGPDDAAPRVIAKGADLLAAKIRAAAYRNGVVVTENKPLARALYRQCKLGAFVPAALYEAVAIVLAMAYRRYGRTAA